MEKLEICGGNRLFGEIDIHGAKNSALPILCASILCDGKTILHNCPNLSDVNNTIEIMKYLGCKVQKYEHTIEIDSNECSNSTIPEAYMQKMRSSIIFMGALLSKNNVASICFPGGCELGPRPIDIHLACLEKMGVIINEENGNLDCSVNKCIRGTNLNLPFASVGATENIILASVKAKGTTRIFNAAREPEIVDLVCFLNKCGANISGAGESTIIINGVKKLYGCVHSIISDRIEASTYMCFAGTTNGKLRLNNTAYEHLQPVVYAFREAGYELNIGEDYIEIDCKDRPKRIKQVKSMVYPGFPTDSMMPLIAMCCVADGTSVFEETIFQNRFKAVDELIKMGAIIKTIDRVAIIEGVERLHSAKVTATDLRAGAALVCAGLNCKGTSVVSNIHHIDRGYENLEKNLCALGADIKRI